MRVVVMREGVEPAGSDTDRRAVAYLQWPAGRVGVAVASVERAQWVVESGLGSEELRGPANLQRQALGRVLGRAVAHEMGHYLLHTPDHARTGLMRATFHPRELVDVRRGGFALSDPDVKLLAHLASERAPMAPVGFRAPVP
jgi:hypothetical protein